MEGEKSGVCGSVDLPISKRKHPDDGQLTLKKRILLSPPHTTPTGTLGLGCHTKSVTPDPAP